VAKQTEAEQKALIEKSKELTTAVQPPSGVRDYYGGTDRPPLDGASPRVSEIFRRVLASRFSGFTVKEACTQIGIDSSRLNKHKRDFPAAWQAANQEIKEAVLQNLAANVWIVRSALSDVAPHAVRCLYELITSRTVKDSIRKDAAVQVLKLLDIDGSASLGATISEAAYAFKDLADATRETFKNDHIVDINAEEAETIDD
jgi:hypothetical protein